MKIAIIGILANPIKKNALGGTEYFNYNLVEELVNRGHEVALYATTDSQSSAKLKGFLDSKIFIKEYKNSQRRAGVMTEIMMADFLNEQESYDIVHLNTPEWMYFLPFIKDLKIPHLITVHSKILENNDYKFLAKKFPETNLVFISNSFKNSFPNFKNSSVIYNGIPSKGFTKEAEDYIFWMGRIIEYKGIEEVIAISKKINKKFIVAGARLNTEYFLKKIKPLIDSSSNIEFIGEVETDKAIQYLSKAKFFINPIKWEEPFGLVMIESMACGTPVISFNRGAVPEIVVDGKTGYICPPGDIDCMIKKIEEIYALSQEDYLKMRENSYNRVKKYFSLGEMVGQYENLYKNLIKNF